MIANIRQTRLTKQTLQLGREKAQNELGVLVDIVYWKDGREVYDSVNVTYRYSDGTKIAYESLISNKFNGMEDQILGHKGTMEMAKGIYYLEEDHSTSGIRQLIGQVKDKVFAAIPTAGHQLERLKSEELSPLEKLPEQGFQLR